MTHIDVDGVGYTQASALLGDANRWAAVHVSTLSRALAGTGAMAGDSSFAGEFAAAYDEAAAATVDAFDDVVGSLAALCRITYASYENHARAELSSILSTVVISADPDPMSHELQMSLSPKPPSSLGADASFLPDWATVVLDHVEGFVWPDADVDRLRDAARAWRSASEHLDGLVHLVGGAVNELWTQRSPEISPAMTVLAELNSGICDLADTCAGLGTVCDDYADQVEAQRELILDLVRDMIRDALLIAAAGFVLGLVTGGSANAVAAWINAGKLGTYAPRLKGFVEALRMYAAGAATGLRATTGAVARTHATFRRMMGARIALYGAERGAVSLAKPMTWLGMHEGGPAKAHTLARHVGKSNRYLRRRLLEWPKIKEASTFTDRYVAEHSIKRAITHYSKDVKAWLDGAGPPVLRRELDLGATAGRIMARDGTVRPGQVIRVVLHRDPTMPQGFRLHTSYLVD